MAGVLAPRRAAPGRGSLPRLGKGDRIALGVLLLVPVILYLPFSIVGHPLVPGDDLTQNYPLRVLSGDLLRAGHLPAWDPLIWSGTPLLAGWNAGALYPGTWLFAVLPGVAAWTVNLVAVSVVCGVGVYALLRLLSCQPLGSVLGALSFTYAGFMSGQLVHIGLVQGTGFTAWMLVGIELVVRARSLRRAAGPVLLIAVSSGLCVLAGEPRAISSAVIIAGVYVLGRTFGAPRRRAVRDLGLVAVGAVIGTGISAIQWLPGLAFVTRSQRTLDAYQAFGAGSLAWTTVAHNLLAPFLLGGNGTFGQPLYAGGYNIPELTVGLGLLPLAAACAYLPDVVRDAASAIGRFVSPPAKRPSDATPPERPGRRLGVWYVMAGVGLVLTFGTTTPVGRVLVKIPLFGGERLQNRNAVIFDLAFAVLLGFFVDDLAAARDPSVRPPVLATWRRRAFALVPPVACLALIAVAYLYPLGVERRFGVGHETTDFFVRLDPYLGVTAGLAIAIGMVLGLSHRLPVRARIAMLAVLSCAETGVYLANASYGTAPSAVLAGPTSASRALSSLTGGGRIAVYNPRVLPTPQAPQASSEVGSPDLNVLRGLPSIQGYGSIVSGTYQDATSTHDLQDLDPAALHDGLANALDLSVLLTLPTYLAQVLPPHSAIPVAGAPEATGSGKPGLGSDAPAPQLLSSGPWTVASRAAATWFLPSVVSVVRVTVVLNAIRAQRPTEVAIGLGRPGAATVYHSAAVVNGQAHLVLAAVQRAETVVVRNPGSRPVSVGAVLAVTRRPGERLLLNGALQGAMPTPQWSFSELLGPYSVFVNHDPSGLAWLQPADSTSTGAPSAAEGSVTTTLEGSSGAEQMVVTSKAPALLVRSVAFQPGWSAEIGPASGPASATRSVPTEALGLLQAVRVPAGRSRVTWRYASRSLLVGGSLTLGSVAICILFGAVVLSRRRRVDRRALGGSGAVSP